MNRKIFLVLPFLLVSLVLGTYNGLIRIGLDIPVNKAVAQHGAIMVGSFLSTLILLERITIFRKTWLYLFPLINGASVIFFLTGRFLLGMQMLIVGGIAMAGIFIYLYSLYRQLFVLIMLIGTISLLGGYMMLINSRFYPVSVPFWFAFILLIITGERLELTKFLPVGKAVLYMLLAAIVLYFAGFVLNYHNSGHVFTGLSMMLMALWLFRYDIAFKSLKMTGLHRYIATNLLAGYFWLIISGLLMMVTPDLPFVYDATIHTFFLGFTFSMIFAHGPIILPGIIKIKQRPFHPGLYIWGMLLHFSLIIRLVSDFLSWIPAREIAGILNMTALLGFFINIFILLRQPVHKPV